jgi:hypothetical protein
MATASAQAVAARGISARAIAANSALKKIGDLGYEKFHASDFGGVGLRRGRLR